MWVCLQHKVTKCCFVATHVKKNMELSIRISSSTTMLAFPTNSIVVDNISAILIVLCAQRTAFSPRVIVLSAQTQMIFHLEIGVRIIFQIALNATSISTMKPLLNVWLVRMDIHLRLKAACSVLLDAQPVKPIKEISTYSTRYSTSTTRFLLNIVSFHLRLSAQPAK